MSAYIPLSPPPAETPPIVIPPTITFPIIYIDMFTYLNLVAGWDMGDLFSFSDELPMIFNLSDAYVGNIDFGDLPPILP